VSPSPGVEILRFGERALLVRLADQAQVHALGRALLPDLLAGRLEDVVPGDRTLLVTFEGTDAAEASVRQLLADAGRRDAEDRRAIDGRPLRHRTIPVVYGGEGGPDLEATAELSGLSPQALIERHAGRDYPVLFLGFAPGFAYCGELPADLAVPRLDAPRTSTPPGSVAVAEGYTGIYPAAFPGGWRVIGWTPVLLFDPGADPPTYLLPGDTVRFIPVGRADLPDAPFRAPDWSPQ
jgi:KipI family sensor histidine kinase inhibitor